MQDEEEIDHYDDGGDDSPVTGLDIVIYVVGAPFLIAEIARQHPYATAGIGTSLLAAGALILAR